MVWYMIETHLSDDTTICLKEYALVSYGVKT